MARLTELSKADVADLCGAFDLGGPTAFSALDAGTVNSNFRVDTTRGRFFLRINEGKQAREVETEACLIDALVPLGVPTPRPLRARDGGWFVPLGEPPKYCSAFPWIAGRHLVRAELAVADVHAAGEALGRLHLAGAALPPAVRERLGPGSYTVSHLEVRLATIRASNRADLVPAEDRLRTALADVAGTRDPGLPVGPIHQDLFLDNVLFDPDRRLVALLDFEQAVVGPYAYDVAVTLLAWAFGSDDFEPALSAGLIAGYESVRALAPRERAGLFAEARLAAVRFSITRLTDVTLRATIGGASSGKSYRRYLDRLDRLEAHGESGFQALIRGR